MSKAITDKIYDMICEYHLDNGDIEVRPVRYVPGIRCEDSGILVRVVNCEGVRFSCVDTVRRDSHGNEYISEIASCERKDEKMLLKLFGEE